MLYRNRNYCAEQRVDILQWSYTAAALMERKVLLCPILSTLKVKEMFFHVTGPVPRGLVSISMARRLQWLITCDCIPPLEISPLSLLYTGGGLHPGPLGSSRLSSLC